MTLKEALEYYDQGKKIKLKSWPKDAYLRKGEISSFQLHNNYLEDDIWEVLEEPRPKNKVKLYAYVERNAVDASPYLWPASYSTSPDINNMLRLPNLDQEIEVDE